MGGRNLQEMRNLDNAITERLRSLGIDDEGNGPESTDAQKKIEKKSPKMHT